MDTRCVHAGEGTDPQTKAIRRPIHMANSYELPTDVEELVKTLSWDHLDKFAYTREHNPTARHLEERLAELEGGEDCVVSASGMGAIAATLFALLERGRPYRLLGDLLHRDAEARLDAPSPLRGRGLDGGYVRPCRGRGGHQAQHEGRLRGDAG